MPDNVLAKVWAHFDRAIERTGAPWPIVYRFDEDERLARLREMGTRAFTSMVYPHKPGMAAWLNEWSAAFAARTAGCLHTATFYPEPGVTDYVATALDAGARVFKVHLQVGDYDPRHPLLGPVWATLAERAIPVVVHAGSGPHRGRFTGPGLFGEVLDAHPGLPAIIAHMGMPEYREFFQLLRRHPASWLDTTMAFTDFAERLLPFPPALRAQLADLGDRVLFGSDYPNIPHSYAHQLDALARLDMGRDWLRAVLWANGARLFGL